MTMMAFPAKRVAVALAVCGCLSLVATQVPGFGSCPSKVQAQSTFNITRYLGHWHEIYAFPAIFEWGSKCVGANYTLKEDGHINVDNSGYRNGKYLHAIGDAYCPDPSKPAQLAVRFYKDSPYGNYWVIDTDYENYSLVFSCGSLFNIAHVEFAWILSRRPQLDPPTVNRLMTLLKDAGVDVDHFHQTDQSDCPGRPGPSL